MNRIAPTLQQNQNDRSGQTGQIQQLQEQLAEKSRLLEQAQQRLAELEAEQDFFKTIVNSLPIPIFVKEAQELRFVIWNKASETLFGFTQEAILGKNDYDLFPPHEADFFTDKDRIVLAGDQVLDIPEEPIHTAHQDVRWLHTRKIPIRGEDGESKYLLGVSEDITERKQAEDTLGKSESTYQALLNAIPDLMIRLNQEGVYLDFHVPKGMQTLGAVNEVLGKTEYEVLPVEVATQRMQYVKEALQTGEIQIFEYQLPLGGEIRYEEARIVPSGKEEVLLIVRDITERKRAEETLIKRAAELACLNDIGRELEGSPPVPELLEWVTGRIPPTMQHSSLCRVAIEYEDHVFGVPEAIDLPAQMTHGLYIGGEIKGRIYIAYTEKHDFLNEESALLGGIATRLSSYLENRRLFEQIQARVRREQLLREVTTHIRGSVDVDTVMRTVAREVGQALGRPAFIYLGQSPAEPETPSVAGKEEA